MLLSLLLLLLLLLLLILALILTDYILFLIDVAHASFARTALFYAHKLFASQRRTEEM